MPSASDSRAGFLLVLLAAAGVVVRAVTADRGAPGALGYRLAATDRPSRDSVAARAARLARPLARDERIDLDGAPAEELVRLPRIGPALARRIVADREAHGPFGSLEALDRVSGIGPTVLKAIAPHASFSATPAAVVGRLGGAAVVSLNTASEEELRQLPGLGPRRARAIVEDRARRGPFARLEDLARVPGIGAVTVERLRGRVRVP